MMVSMDAREPPKPPTKPAIQFSVADQAFIDPYLRPAPAKNETQSSASQKPFLTLTYAQSLDSKLSLTPGVQTVLSGLETKAMTHYLRSKHDAILVGVGTAVADNPALNCRLEGIDTEGQPRPVILDPKARWSPGKWPEQLSAAMTLAYYQQGKGPWIITTRTKNQIDNGDIDCVRRCSGDYISLADVGGQMDWNDILDQLGHRGIKSLMVEGGAHVINTLLQEKYVHLIDSIIITIAPVWLGDGGVSVSPPTVHLSEGDSVPLARLRNVKWQQFGQDVVMCGNVQN